MKPKQIRINPKILARLNGDDLDKAKEAVYALVKEGHKPATIAGLVGYQESTVISAFEELINDGKLKEEEVYTNES